MNQFSDPLPNDDQRRQLGELLYEAFVELRGIYGQSEQVHALAYAFHNLPLTMHGWGTWNWDGMRAVLARYREQFPNGGPDYPAMLDKVRNSNGRSSFHDASQKG